MTHLPLIGQAASIYLSIHYLNCLFCSGLQRAGAFPSTHWTGGGVRPGQVTGVLQQQRNKWSKYVKGSLQRYHIIQTEASLKQKQKMYCSRSYLHSQAVAQPPHPPTPQHTNTHTHTHTDLFSASMTAWSCDAESDKLISKSLWYWEKRENEK